MIEGCWAMWKARRDSWLSLQGDSLAITEAKSELHKVDGDVGKALQMRSKSRTLNKPHKRTHG